MTTREFRSDVKTIPRFTTLSDTSKRALWSSSQAMHAAHPALGSSLQALGGSVAFKRFSFSALRQEVKKILAQKRRAIGMFQDERLQDILNKFMSMSEVKEIDKKFTTVEGLGAFSSLIASTRAELEELQHSELLVSIFGTLKVGKSTLGNRLLEKSRFASAETPLTSFATTFHSADRFWTRATFVPFIESVVDIRSLMLVAGVDDPELEKQYADLFANGGLIDGETLPNFVTRPRPELRHTPIIAKLDCYGPIWDIKESGIAIADCPGTKEIGALSNIAHFVASNSAVIVYLCDGSSKISEEDEDVILITEQLQQGSDVIFVINEKPEHTRDEILAVNDRIQKIFGDVVDFNASPIFSFDAKLDQPHLEMLQRELAERLHQRARTSVSVFLNFFTELIRAQHLFVSRLLTLHVVRQAESTREKMPNRIRTPPSPGSPGSSSGNTTTSVTDAVQAASSRHRKEVQLINARLKVLWKSCTQRIEQLSLEFNAMISAVVTDFETNLRQEDKFETVPVPVPFNLETASQQSFLGSVFNPQENEFEKEFRRQLQMRLHPLMEHQVNKFGKQSKKKFTTFLGDECSAIEASVLEIKSEQARLVWNRQAAGLFSTLQRDLSAMTGNRSRKVAGVAMSAAGLVGAATLSGVAIAGLLAGTLLTGGALLVASIAATGIGLSAVSLLKDKQAENSERTTRKRVLTRLADGVRRSLASSEQFAAYRQATIKQLESILAAAVHVLSTNLIEIESVWYLDQCPLNIDYTTLCNYLWLRDELTEVTNEILDEIRELDSNLQVSDAAPSEAPLSVSSAILGMKMDPTSQNTRHDSCYVCWRPRTSCGHLCRDCDFLIGAEHCPYCHELPHWIANKIKISPQAKKDLEALIHGAPPTALQGVSRKPSFAQLHSLHSPSSSTGDLTEPSMTSLPDLSFSSFTDAQKDGLDMEDVKSGKFVFDDQKQRVGKILVGFKSQFLAFCTWLESKYTRYLTEPADVGLDVPQEVLSVIQYFINSIIAQTPSIETALTYGIKLKIVECSQDILFARIGPLVQSLVQAKFKIPDEDIVTACERSKALKWDPEAKDWHPGMADPIKMQLAIAMLNSMSQSKTPFAKFQVFKQVWELVHKMHPNIIGSEESWSCFSYILMQASYPHLNSDAFIVTTSLDMFLEGEGYLMTTISTFCNAAQFVSIVNLELEADRQPIKKHPHVVLTTPTTSYALPPHLSQIPPEKHMLLTEPGVLVRAPGVLQDQAPLPSEQALIAPGPAPAAPDEGFALLGQSLEMPAPPDLAHAGIILRDSNISSPDVASEAASSSSSASN